MRLFSLYIDNCAEEFPGQNIQDRFDMLNNNKCMILNDSQ